jgi:hypothetical protein
MTEQPGVVEGAEMRETRTSDELLYCMRCGEATTCIEAVSRKFHTGFSACCNENLRPYPPAYRCPRKVYIGNAPGTPIT